MGGRRAKGTSDATTRAWDQRTEPWTLPTDGAQLFPSAGPILRTPHAGGLPCMKLQEVVRDCRALYGRYHATFADFRAAIEQTLAGIPIQHAAALTSLMTLNFQRFENVSLMAA